MRPQTQGKSPLLKFILVAIIAHCALLFGVAATGATKNNRCVQSLVTKPELLFNRALPIFEQSTEYTCGPTVLLSLLEKRHLRPQLLSDTALALQLDSNPTIGTSPELMVMGALKFGLRAEIHQASDPNEYLRQLQPDRDYILLINDDSEAHWVAISRLTQNEVYLMDPYQNAGRLTKMPLHQLIEKWREVDFDQHHTYHFLSIEIE